MENSLSREVLAPELLKGELARRELTASHYLPKCVRYQLGCGPRALHSCHTFQ